MHVTIKKKQNVKVRSRQLKTRNSAITRLSVRRESAVFGRIFQTGVLIQLNCVPRCVNCRIRLYNCTHQALNVLSICMFFTFYITSGKYSLSRHLA